MPKYGWTTATMRKSQYNGLAYLAKKDDRPVMQYLYLLLRKAGVPELTDQELETKLSEKERKNVVKEVIAR